MWPRSMLWITRWRLVIMRWPFYWSLMGESFWEAITHNRCCRWLMTLEWKSSSTKASCFSWASSSGVRALRVATGLSRVLRLVWLGSRTFKILWLLKKSDLIQNNLTFIIRDCDPLLAHVLKIFAPASWVAASQRESCLVAVTRLLQIWEPSRT